MPLAVVFIIVFGTAALVPAVWSIVGLIRGNTKFWPCVAGTGFALVLLIITLVGIATHWGGCPVLCDALGNCGTSAGSVQCYQNVKGTWTKQCEPDVWKEECHQSVGCVIPSNSPTIPDKTVSIPAGSHCPTGSQWVTVYAFCEPIQSGGVKQPWATWSDLSFVAAGLWLLWVFQYFGTSPRLGDEDDNPMTSISVLSVAYCFIVIFMGPPSMWYHASMKDWGGWFDTMSVVAWLGFNAVYVIYLLVAAMWGRGRTMWQSVVVLGGWILLMFAFGLIALNPGARLYLYFATGGPWGVAEVIYVFVAARSRTSGVRYRRTWFLFLANFLLLATTMTLWIFFNDGIVKQGCAQRAGFPGHALFHIMASISTMLTFFSFASERATTSLNDTNTFNPFRNA